MLRNITSYKLGFIFRSTVNSVCLVAGIISAEILAYGMKKVGMVALNRADILGVVLEF